MLDENQMIAAQHKEGPMMVLAGPGSGKTTVITERVKLLTEAGVDPTSVLVVTFTRAAAQEMKIRYLRLAGREETGVTFGTFHAVFYGILRAAYSFGSDVFLSEREQVRLIRDAMKREGLDAGDEEDGSKEILQAIGRKKNTGKEEEKPPSLCEPEQFRRIEREYEETKRRRKKLDFDDILWKTKELLSERKDILLSWQRKYRYLLVDEFQDINPMQYEVVRLLAAPENNLFIVGDDDQSIYRFRGAEPSIMLRFPEDYPEAETVCLGINYRCQKNVVELSKNLIAHNHLRYEKEIKAVRRAGEEAVFQTFPDYREEHEAVLKELRRLHDELAFHFREMAVLLRTNQQGELLMEKMMKENLPFQTGEACPNRYCHWITKDVFAYLEAAAGNRDRGLFLRLINRPKRYISRESFATDPVDFSLVKQALSERPDVLNRFLALEQELSILQGMKPFAAVNYIRRGIGYDDYIREYAEKKGLQPEDFLEKLEELLYIAKGMDSFAAWKREAERYTKELMEQQKNRKNADAVTIATLHGAKGLEYRAVFIIDCVDTLFPYKKARTEEDREEERRMFYVGLTRAKDRLYLYDVKKMHRHEMAPSPFLEEMGKNRLFVETMNKT